MTLPFNHWHDLFHAPRSAFYAGHTRDTLFDQAANNTLSPNTEAMFTQSNARVLLGQSANGNLRMLAIPTQVYPAPTMNGEFGLGPGMYHHFDVAMYLGDLHYKILLEGDSAEIDLSSSERDNTTWYADHYLPLTQASAPGLEMHLVSLAPVAADGEKAALTPAPLPGPAGALYLLHIRNTSSQPQIGKVILEAGDFLIGHYEDAVPERIALNHPAVSLRQHTLILSRPDGAVGIHLHDGSWVKTDAPFQAERAFSLAPGEETLVETHLAIGATYPEVMPTIFALHLSPALEWFNRTAVFWRSRMGELSVHADGAEVEAQVLQESYLRALFDNFNCLQTDPQGNLIAHWQGAPSHGYGTIWGIDVEPTAASVVHLVPEITRQTMIFFMTRSRVPVGPKDHSVPILVAPVVLARQWLQATGDTAFLASHPEILSALQGIMDELLTLKAPDMDLFPSRYSSDGPVGRRYDFGTNAKVCYAFDSMAYLLKKTGREQAAGRYSQIAAGVKEAIHKLMVVDGPFGPQLSGGTNLGEDPQGFYLPEDALYYDGEDTSSMLAPIYGACEYDWQPWVNYHRYARSLWCHHFDPEFGVLNWFPRESAVVDGTAFFSRLGGSITPEEMKEATAVLRTITDDVTGSMFWWPHGVEYRRSLTRCSQGQGAWAWQYFEQWLGIQVDVTTHTLSISPRGLLTSYQWQSLLCGVDRFDLVWEETEHGSRLRVANHGQHPWTVRVGFRAPGSGASAALTWQTCILEPERDCALGAKLLPQKAQSFLDADIRRMEAARFTPKGDVLFKRFGPAMLWGHWDTRLLWNNTKLPNSLRFMIANNTGENWQNVVVILTCPPGWMGMGRQPKHWPLPDQLQPGEVCLNLGTLANSAHLVAPFWIRSPGGRGLLSPLDQQTVSPHTASQPGDGLRLVDPDGNQPDKVNFTAELRATTTSGKTIQCKLQVPVELLSTHK